MAIALLATYGCTNLSTGFYRLTEVNGGTEPHSYSFVRQSDGAVLAADSFTLDQLPLEFGDLYDDAYTLTVRGASGGVGRDMVTLSCANPAPGGGGGTPPGAGSLKLDSVRRTTETAAGSDGTATIQASGGTAPLTASLVELSLSQAATSGQPNVFTGLPASRYTLRVTDSSSPVQQVEGQVLVGPYVAPKTGCLDEYATNYDPAATTAGVCTYAPRWRSAWGPSGVAVAVPALPGQVRAYTVAELRIGFRVGHPLAALRPLGAALTLRATVGPQGFAVFRLGPYLHSTLGAGDGAEGYRLDLNSDTALTSDLYVGYELRRPTGELLEHGYAVNAAVPDEHLPTLLSPFPVYPLWPGFAYAVPWRIAPTAGRYETLAVVPVEPENVEVVRLPCPPNPLPVRWLAPQGGYRFWVFAGRPQLSTTIGENQTYTEAETGQFRYSQRGTARRVITASSGVFKGPELMEGLRTLWTSPQVWYQPVVGG